MANHIYLIREREFIRLNEPTYKLGKTEQDGLKRSAQYPKGSSIEIHLHVNDCHTAERDLLEIFRHTFIPMTEYGAEYFKGDVQAMLVEIFKYRCTTQITPIIPQQLLATVPTIAMCAVTAERKATYSASDKFVVEHVERCVRWMREDSKNVIEFRDPQDVVTHVIIFLSIAVAPYPVIPRWWSKHYTPPKDASSWWEDLLERIIGDVAIAESMRIVAASGLTFPLRKK